MARAGAAVLVHPGDDGAVGVRVEIVPLGRRLPA